MKICRKGMSGIAARFISAGMDIDGFFLTKGEGKFSICLQGCISLDHSSLRDLCSVLAFLGPIPGSSWS